jgi:hypothetical protein
MIRTSILLFFLTFHLRICQAQLFHVSDTVVNIIKQSDNGVVHYYSEIFNDTTVLLNMRWIRHTGPNYPSNWITYFQDPQTYYNPLMNTDSADFYLDTVLDNMDKLIYQVNHQGHVGRGTSTFTVFPVNHRSDSIHVTFNVKITPATNTGIHTIDNADAFMNSQEIYEEIQVYNTLGQLIEVFYKANSSIIFNQKNKGLIFVVAKNKYHETQKIKLFIN